ncbi:MAG: AsmA family protein [Woeseiaceae bacterium]|nr:AsmA family protein [Woeseiaceae bacterium]
MKSPLRILLGAFAAALLVLACLVLYVLFGDLSVHRDRVLAAASDASGLYIASDGPFELEVGREVSLTIENAIVGNPAYPDEHPLASVGLLRLVVDTWSLFRGPVEIDLLAIENTIVNLKQSADGSANWVPAAEPDPAATEQEPAPLPVVHRITLDDVSLRFESSGVTQFVADDLLLRIDRNRANDYQLSIATQFGSSLPNMRIIAEGSTTFGPAMDDIRSAKLVIDDAAFEQSGDFELDALLSGSVAADLAGERPSFDVDINVRNLISRSPDTEEQPEGEPDQLLFSTTPLDYSWLDDFDLQAALAIDLAVVGSQTIRDVSVVTRIEDGALQIEPAELAIGDGTLSGTLQLEPADGDYSLNLTTRVNAIQLEQLAAEGQARDTVPPLSIDLQLTGNGQSLHEIMASSSGQISGRQGEGQLDLQGAGALFADFLTSIVRTLNPLAEERTYTDIECGILAIDIESGVATIEELALQSDRLTIVSGGKVDFSTEEIDLTLNTKSREGLGLSVGGVANSFVKIGGTLREPAVGVDAAGTVTTTGAAVATGGLSVLAKGLWDRLSSEVDLCSLPDE